MVTAGHLACGPLTAMRSLSSALGNRHDQEGTARHRPVGGGRRDDHDRRRPGGYAPARAHDQAGTCGRGGGRRVRPGRPGGVRHGGDGQVPVAGEPGGSPPRSPPPRYSAARYSAARYSATRRPAARRSSARRGAGRRARRARRRGAFRAAAPAEPDERVLTRRAHRSARGEPRARNAGRPGHPGDPAHRGTRAGSRRAGSRGSRRRARPGTAALGLDPTSASAPRLPAGNEPRRRSRPDATRPGRPAGAPHATPRVRTSSRGAAGGQPDAGPRRRAGPRAVPGPRGGSGAESP
jgi:hypothetical protein